MKLNLKKSWFLKGITTYKVAYQDDFRIDVPNFILRPPQKSYFVWHFASSKIES